MDRGTNTMQKRPYGTQKDPHARRPRNRNTRGTNMMQSAHTERKKTQTPDPILQHEALTGPMIYIYILTFLFSPSGKSEYICCDNVTNTFVLMSMNVTMARKPNVVISENTAPTIGFCFSFVCCTT